jgi:cold shock CspA family protein
MIRQQGKVLKWFDDKGYGFLSPDDGSEQIFSHISAFPKLEKRPVIGEAVTFQVVKDVEKGFQAKNVLYLNRPTSISVRRNSKKQKKQINYSLVIFIVAIILVGSFILLKYSSLGVDKVSEQPNSLEVTNSIERAKDFQIKSLKSLPPTGVFENLNSNEAFQCSGKTSCSQMTSCAEATYYLNHCPGSVMDGDGDGIPCEDQWCGH